VSDDPSRTPSIGFDNARASLATQGYALVNDEIIGLPTKFRETFLSKYFNDRVLRHDEVDVPKDRERARDVIRYQWCDDGLRLWEHSTITITDRADIAGKRDHSRVQLLDDPDGEELVRTFLSLVPSARRQNDGTFGVNLFRTHTNVVTKPHRDNEEFIVLYVLDRVGAGAESSLYNATDVSADGMLTAGPVVKHQLNPGEILMFDDERFIHDATPLQAPLGGKARRDVLVCTVDYRSTYLDQTPPLRDERIAMGSSPC
jgi:2-oxoglutarate-Fe(II)-dependent dioxygenase family protein